MLELVRSPIVPTEIRTTAIGIEKTQEITLPLRPQIPKRAEVPTVAISPQSAEKDQHRRRNHLTMPGQNSCKSWPSAKASTAASARPSGASASATATSPTMPEFANPQEKLAHLFANPGGSYTGRNYGDKNHVNVLLDQTKPTKIGKSPPRSQGPQRRVKMPPKPRNMTLKSTNHT